MSGRTKHYSPSKHNKKLPYCTIKIIFTETFLHSTHIFFTKKNKKMARKKVCLQGNIPAGKYSRGFRKNNKNSWVFPHKNISLYSIFFFFFFFSCLIISSSYFFSILSFFFFFFFLYLSLNSVRFFETKIHLNIIPWSATIIVALWAC